MNDELTYLRWIVANMDFGPAHEDVVADLNRRYTDETGNNVPNDWKDEE